MSNGLNGSAEVTDVSISSPHNMTVLQARINSHTQTLSQLARCGDLYGCLLYTSPSPRDQRGSRMPSSA